MTFPAIDFQAEDALLDELAAELAPRQHAAQRARGRYWQGLQTPAAVPEEGERLPPDLTRKPTDQPDDWAAAGPPLPPDLPLAVAVHTYDGPQGQGYVLLAWAKRGGRVWVAARAVGPEEARAHGWRPLEEER